MSLPESSRKPGLIILFGSGEMSPTGRGIHEAVIARAKLVPPVKIGILETPTGFEVNAISSWPARMEAFFCRGLKNYQPRVTRIRAWRKDGQYSTNDPSLVDAILSQDYLYCGAGSPTYLVKHLSGSRAFRNLLTAHRQGVVLSLGSATAVAMSRYAIPVYEIFKVGADLYWQKGLNFFASLGLGQLVIVPHWNNREGQNFDTNRCYLGRARFAKLVSLLPDSAVILGIDEQTACLFDPTLGTFEVMGKGRARVISQGREKVFAPGKIFHLT